MLQNSISQILDKIKEDLLKNEFFSKNNPDTNNIGKIAKFIEQAMIKGAGEIFAECLQNCQPTQNSVTVNGEMYYFKEVVSKTFLTTMGEITVARRTYRSKNGKIYVPLDALWGTHGEYSDLSLREMIAFLAAGNTPAEIEEIFRRFMPAKPSQDYIRKIADRVGAVMDSGAEIIQKTAQQEEKMNPKTKVVAVSIDGVNVAVREKGEKRRRPAFRPKSVKKANITKADSDNDDQKNCCYKNAMVATVTFYGDKPLDKKTPERLGGIYQAQMPEPKYPTLKRRFELEIERFTKMNNLTKVFITDGAPHLWNYKSKTPQLDDWTEILDYYHATERLNALAEAIFGATSVEAKRWYDQYSKLLLESNNATQRMLRSAKYYQQKFSRSKAATAVVQRELSFFRKNISRTAYKRFREEGLPIGSGPVEAACKTIVKARLCGSGMRWSIPGGQRVLALRVQRKSNRWDTAWKYYLDNQVTNV